MTGPLVPSPQHSLGSAAQPPAAQVPCRPPVTGRHACEAPHHLHASAAAHAPQSESAAQCSSPLAKVAARGNDRGTHKKGRGEFFGGDQVRARSHPV